MPELPEVEVCRRGLQPEVEGQMIVGAEVRSPRLRLPLAADLGATLVGQQVVAVRRRGKFFDAVLQALKRAPIPVAGADPVGWKGGFEEPRAGHQHEAVDILVRGMLAPREPAFPIVLQPQPLHVRSRA